MELPFGKDEFVYLACPYKSTNDKQRLARVAAINAITIYLIREGYTVFSPISYSVGLINFGVATEKDPWIELDLGILNNSQHLAIVKFPEWEDSIGVGKERVRASENSIKTSFINYLLFESVIPDSALKDL